MEHLFDVIVKTAVGVNVFIHSHNLCGESLIFPSEGLSVLCGDLSSKIEVFFPLVAQIMKEALFSVSDKSRSHTPCGGDSFSLLMFLLQTN